MAMRQYVTESLAFLLAQNMDRGIVEYQSMLYLKLFDGENQKYLDFA